MTDKWPEVYDRELTRLHKLVEAGKEVAWATSQIERLIRLMTEPIFIPGSSGQTFR